MTQVVDFIAAYPLFIVATVLVLIALAITIMQSARAHRYIYKTSIRENYWLDFLPEDRERFWQHAVHEDGQYNERLNFFLVFESILLGVVAALYVKSGADVNLLAVTTLGLIITLLWLNIQVYHKYYLDSFSPRLERLPEFAETAKYNQHWRPGTTRKFLSWLIPLTVALIWLGMIGVFLNVRITL